jgi:hypothetical protein
MRRGGPFWARVQASGSECSWNTLAKVLADDMTNSPEVVLQQATSQDADLLGNLLELYVHDLSEIFPVEIGADGRFGYARLALYWSAPDTRFAFLIKHGDRVSGFALVTRGSPATANPEDLDLGVLCAPFQASRGHR